MMSILTEGEEYHLSVKQIGSRLGPTFSLYHIYIFQLVLIVFPQNVIKLSCNQLAHGFLRK